MSRATQRPLNECNDCGDTWYARGRDLSHKCPYCGSTDVQYANNGGCLGVLLVGLLILAGIGALTGNDSPDPAPTQQETSEVRPAPAPPAAPPTLPTPPDLPAPPVQQPPIVTRHGATYTYVVPAERFDSVEETWNTEILEDPFE